MKLQQRVTMREVDIHMLQMKCNFLTLGNTKIHPNQIAVLNVMRNLGPSTQRTLAKELRCSPASVGVSVKRMERTGLVEKQAVEEDLRRTRVVLTSKGVEMAEYCAEVFERLADRKYEGFSDEELTLLNEFLGRIAQNLERYQEELAAKKTDERRGNRGRALKGERDMRDIRDTRDEFGRYFRE